MYKLAVCSILAPLLVSCSQHTWKPVRISPDPFGGVHIGYQHRVDDRHHAVVTTLKGEVTFTVYEDSRPMLSSVYYTSSSNVVSHVWSYSLHRDETNGMTHIISDGTVTESISIRDNVMGTNTIFWTDSDGDGFPERRSIKTPTSYSQETVSPVFSPVVSPMLK